MLEQQSKTLWFVLILVWGSNAAQEPVCHDTEKCDHGCWTGGQCQCHPGWRHAGPTDVFSFLEGKCEQSQCTDDDQCMRDLGDLVGLSHSAICPVRGWNCYCGWRFAFAESWTGASNSRAKCTGVLYTLSISGSRMMVIFMREAYKWFFRLAILLFAFGQTHVRCQHNNPDMYKMFHACGACGSGKSCRGNCTSHPISNFVYEFAWSLYVIDLMLWTYAFSIALYFVLGVTWILLIWVLIALVLLVAAVMVLVGAVGACCAAACGEDGDAGCCADSHNCGDVQCGSCDCCDANGCGCYDASSNTDVFYFYNTDFYYDGRSSDWDCCTSSGGQSSRGQSSRGLLSRCRLLRPLGWLISKMPNLPPNMWGGLLGRCMGTRDGGRYRGGNWLIDRLSFRSSADLRSNDQWKNRVAHYIYNVSDDPNLTGGTEVNVITANQQSDWIPSAPPLSQPEPGLSYMPTPSAPSNSQIPLLRQKVQELDGKTLVNIDRPFDVGPDRIVESCFEDYKSNECWICCGCNVGRPDLSPSKQWHLWMTCGHMFCAQCSTEMIRRRMPCPLCRRITNRIKEGPPFKRVTAGP